MIDAPEVGSVSFVSPSGGGFCQKRGHFSIERKKERGLFNQFFTDKTSTFCACELLRAPSRLCPGFRAERRFFRNMPPRGTDKTDKTSGVAPMTLVSIDIGVSGAGALFDDAGRLLAVEDLPVLADGPAGRPTLNACLLAALVRRWAPDQAVVEHVSARPGEAASGAFGFGRSRGAVEGVLGACSVPIEFRTPAWWKRRCSIPPGSQHKDLARSRAIARWPEHAELFARKLDHDRAEACLLGAAYLDDRGRR